MSVMLIFSIILIVILQISIIYYYGKKNKGNRSVVQLHESELKKIGQRIQLEKQTTQEILNVMDKPSFIINENSQILFWNENFSNQQKEKIYHFMDAKQMNLDSFEIKPINQNYSLIQKKAYTHTINPLQKFVLDKQKELNYIHSINVKIIENVSVERLIDEILDNINESYGILAAKLYEKEDNTWIERTYKRRKYLNENYEGFYVKEIFEDNLLKNTKLYFKNVENDGKCQSIVSGILENHEKRESFFIIYLKTPLDSNKQHLLKVFYNQLNVIMHKYVIYEELRNVYVNTIEALVNVIEAKDKYTEGHSRRVAKFAVELGKEMGLGEKTLEDIAISGLLHDIGKIAIDPDILNKEGKLTKEEYECIKKHPEYAVDILNSIEFSPEIMEGVLYHHLRFDLRGYPQIKIDKLPLFPAIIGAADAFDAMTSARSYSRPRGIDEALNDLLSQKGKQFCPEVVDAFVRLAREKRVDIESIISDKSSMNEKGIGEQDVISSTLSTVASS